MTDPTGSIARVDWDGEDKQVAVVRAVGDIDLQRSAEFQSGLLAVAARNPRRIVVDLSDVPYMDSSGIASLVKLLARARREKIDLKLACLQPRVRAVMEITHLDGVFEIRETAEEAIGA